MLTLGTAELGAVLALLDPRSVGRAACVCRALRTAATNDTCAPAPPRPPPCLAPSHARSVAGRAQVRRPGHRVWRSALAYAWGVTLRVLPGERGLVAVSAPALGACCWGLLAPTADGAAALSKAAMIFPSGPPVPAGPDAAGYATGDAIGGAAGVAVGVAAAGMVCSPSATAFQLGALFVPGPSPLGTWPSSAVPPSSACPLCLSWCALTAARPRCYPAAVPAAPRRPAARSDSRQHCVDLGTP